MTNASPAALLLTGARPTLDAHAGGQLATLAAAIGDWDRVRAEAGAHGILPPLTRALDDWAAGAIPAAALLGLREAARASGRRSLRLAGELLAIMDHFAARGVRVLAYKGPTLAVLAYRDLGLRPFRDLDILVDPSDVPVGRAVLEALGYRPGALDPPPGRSRAFIDGASEHPYFRDGGDIVELHWRLLAPCYAGQLPFAELWERRTTIPLGGRAMETLSREDLVLALCVHGASHAWERLEWIADVARLLQLNVEIDWSATVSRARRLGAAHMVGLGVRLATDLLGATTPEVCAPLADAPAVRRLAAAVRHCLFRRPPTVTVSLARRAFHLSAHERWRDRVRYLWQVTITPSPPDWALVRLPAPLVHLYYAIRPVRLALKYARLLFLALPLLTWPRRRA